MQDVEIASMRDDEEYLARMAGVSEFPMSSECGMRAALGI